MTNYTVQAAVVMLLVCLMGCAKQPEPIQSQPIANVQSVPPTPPDPRIETLKELAESISQLGPLPKNDPDLARLKKFLEARHLHWDVTLGATGTTYCASAYKGQDVLANPHSYQIECDHSMKNVTDAMIEDYVKDKPGRDEQWQNKPLAEGGRP